MEYSRRNELGEHARDHGDVWSQEKVELIHVDKSVLVDTKILDLETVLFFQEASGWWVRLESTQEFR